MLLWARQQQVMTKLLLSLQPCSSLLAMRREMSQNNKKHVTNLLLAGRAWWKKRTCMPLDLASHVCLPKDEADVC